MNIKVIMTGGTIGSEVINGVITPSSRPAGRLESEYRKTGGKALFQFDSPFTVLSEDLCAENLNALTGSICAAYENGYKKIIVCHGTDTLQYSAAAVLYALSGTDCAVVFVSAAKPLGLPETNGFDNFTAAAAFLENYTIPGVYAAYKNNGENARILPAQHLALHAEGSDSLNCLNGEYAAEYKDGNIILNPAFAHQKSLRLGFPVSFNKHSGIEIISSAPGRQYEPCKNGTRAVIFRPYHSGTLNTSNEELRNFCLDAKSRNIPLFAVNIRPGAQYASALAFGRLGIIPLPGTAFAPVYIKIWLAGNKTGKELEEFVKFPYAGEILAETGS